MGPIKIFLFYLLLSPFYYYFYYSIKKANFKFEFSRTY